MNKIEAKRLLRERFSELSNDQKQSLLAVINEPPSKDGCGCGSGKLSDHVIDIA